MIAADILYVEDNRDYVQFVKRAVQKINNRLSMDVVMEGREALDMLENTQTKQPLPKLILLDIDLPDYNGLDLLMNIRANPNTRYLPVIMFSSSESPKDMMKAFDLGANAYLVKPMGLKSLTDTMESICNFWLQHHPPVEKFSK